MRSARRIVSSIERLQERLADLREDLISDGSITADDRHWLHEATEHLVHASIAARKIRQAPPLPVCRRCIGRGVVSTVTCEACGGRGSVAA